MTPNMSILLLSIKTGIWQNDALEILFLSGIFSLEYFLPPDRFPGAPGYGCHIM